MSTNFCLYNVIWLLLNQCRGGKPMFVSLRDIFWTAFLLSGAISQPSLGLRWLLRMKNKQVFTHLLSLWGSYEGCSVRSSADFAAGFSSRTPFSQKADITTQSFHFFSIKHTLYWTVMLKIKTWRHCKVKVGPYKAWFRNKYTMCNREHSKKEVTFFTCKRPLAMVDLERKALLPKQEHWEGMPYSLLIECMALCRPANTVGHTELF